MTGARGPTAIREVTAAACGGTTTIVDFAVQSKGQALRTGLDAWHAKAEGNAVIDYGFHMIMSDVNDDTLAEMDQLVAEGVPDFKLVAAGDALPEVAYPAFVKPNCESRSIGISDDSVVHNREEMAQRVRYVHEKLEQAALIEEFLPGEEYTVLMLGNGRLQEILPGLAEEGVRFLDEPKWTREQRRWLHDYFVRALGADEVVQRTAAIGEPHARGAGHVHRIVEQHGQRHERGTGEQHDGLDDLHPGRGRHAAEQHIDHHQRADDDADGAHAAGARDDETIGCRTDGIGR